MIKAGRILLFACLFLWTGVSAWAIANPENRCSRVAAGAIYNARYYDPELGRFIQPDDTLPDMSNPQSYNHYSYCLNDPLTYNDPTGHGVGAVAADAMFNTETLKSSYQLMTMHDTFANKMWEVPTATVGMAAGTADAAFNVLTLGGKGLVEGGLKEGAKVGIEKLTKQGTENVVAQVTKNYEKGKAFEKQVGKELEKTDEKIVSQVTLKTENGNKTVADFLSKDKETGKINVTEAKSSETAKLTPGQTKAHPEIEKSGATVVGEGKPGFPGGTKIPPTKVDVVRPPLN